MVNQLLEFFIKNNFKKKKEKKKNQQEFKIEKVIKKKGDNFYIKWKGYDNSFNSWINEEDLV